MLRGRDLLELLRLHTKKIGQQLMFSTVDEEHLKEELPIDLAFLA